MDLKTFLTWDLASIKYWIIGLGIFILLSVRKKVTDGLFDYIWKKTWLKLKKKFKGSYFLNKSQIVQDRKIHELMIELRALSGGDRACTYQFLNGIKFSNSVPGWKISCTHEALASEIVSDMGIFSNILSSCLINVIGCLWEIDGCARGIEKTSPECCNCLNKTKCILPKGVYLANIEAMSDGYAKFFLRDLGIKYFMYSPLLDAENRFGFVGISYCHEIDKEEIKKHTETLCKYASQVSYIIQK